MSVVNCSFAVFEEMTEFGAIFVDKENSKICVSSCFFFHCTRSGYSGGAILFNSVSGVGHFSKNCFEWCYTNTENGVDYGQSLFSQCSSTDFFDSTLSFCSPNNDIVRNAGVHIRTGEGSTEKVNVSNARCHFAAGIFYLRTTKAIVENCIMVNLTSNLKFDTVSIGESKGNSIFKRIIYIRCTNPAESEKTFPLTIEDCVIVNCTNFPYDQYPTGNNINRTSSYDIDTLTINKERCVMRKKDTIKVGRSKQGKIVIYVKKAKSAVIILSSLCP